MSDKRTIEDNIVEFVESAKFNGSITVNTRSWIEYGICGFNCAFIIADNEEKRTRAFYPMSALRQAATLVNFSNDVGVHYSKFFTGITMDEEMMKLYDECLHQTTKDKAKEKVKVPNTIGQNISKLMQERGLTVEQLADKINKISEESLGSLSVSVTSKEELSGIINGCTPRMRFICAIAFAIDCSCSDLFEGVSSDLISSKLDECTRIYSRVAFARRKREEELKKKAKEFQDACATPFAMVGDLSGDLSFLRYVDRFKALNDALRVRGSVFIKRLLELKGFKDVLTDNNNQIIKTAIEAVSLHPKLGDALRAFCIIATTEEVRETLYNDSSLSDYVDGFIEREGMLATQNLRSMMWILRHFWLNNPTYDCDGTTFASRYTDALLAEALGVEE